MEEIIQRLREDYPGHTFETKEYEGAKIIVIDDNETPLTWTKTKNIEEGTSEDLKMEAENALYEVLKMEVNKVLDDLGKKKE